MKSTKASKNQQRRLAAATLIAIYASTHVVSSVNAWAPPHSFLQRPLSIRRSNVINRIIDNTGAIQPQSQRYVTHLKYGSSSDNTDEDENWRDFRAQLVRSESEDDINDDRDTNNSKKHPSEKQNDDNDHWAYETGDFVERGSIVLSVPSNNEFLNDIDALNNVCYRKSIVLVLDVSPNFIQGIVLNRPTNIGVKEGMQFVQPGHGEVFEDELGSCLGENCEVEYGEDGAPTPTTSARWKVWFGGEAGGPYSDYPQVMCIHSITTQEAMAVSTAVLPGIFVTSFDGAQEIVRTGDANPSDFWLFCGICGWETSTFYEEMHQEGLWHIVSTDSETILEELNMLRCEEEEDLAIVQNCDVDHDPRNAGLHTWEMLMEKIGLEEEVSQTEDSFGDWMLHEWATGALSFSIKEEQTSMIMEPFSDPRFDMMDDDGTDFDLSEYDPASAMSTTTITADVDATPSSSNQRQSFGIVGVMVRASSAKRSPYLLSDQSFHKSLIIILRDGEDYSEGILLNHVTSRSLPLDLGDGEKVRVPIRYGGPAYYYFGDEEDDDDDDGDTDVPTVFLHSDESLRDAGIGIPVGKSRLFTCTKEEVIEVLKSGRLTVDDFMAVQGFSVWTKKDHYGGGGVLGDVESGFFELVPRPKVKQIWDTLLLQEQLTDDTLLDNVSKSRQAWNMASKDANGMGGTTKSDEIHVFGTDIDVTTLADQAAIRWVKVNLL